MLPGGNSIVVGGEVRKIIDEHQRAQYEKPSLIEVGAEKHDENMEMRAYRRRGRWWKAGKKGRGIILGQECSGMSGLPRYH